MRDGNGKEGGGEWERKRTCKLGILERWNIGMLENKLKARRADIMIELVLSK